MRQTFLCTRGSLLGLAMMTGVLAACGAQESSTDGSGGAGGRAGSGGLATGGTGGNASSGGTGGPGTGGTPSTATGGRAAAGGLPGSGGQNATTGGAGGVAGAATGGGGGQTGGGRGGAGGNVIAGSAGSAGKPGAAGVGGPSLCAGGKLLICEDFESTAAGGVPTGWTKHGDATVQTDQAARGTHALKLGAAANGERRIYADAAKLGSGHWGRIFYKVQLPATKPSSGVIHSTLVAFQGNGPKNGSSEYRVVDTVEDANGKHQFLWNVQPSNVGEFGKGSSYNWTYDGQWHCAEWHVDGPTQSYHFYLDGTEITEIAINNGAGKYDGTDIPNSFTDVRVGWNNYQTASPGFVAWIDEVAMDTNRVGCGQ